MYFVDLMHDDGFIIQEPYYDDAMRLFNKYLPYGKVRLLQGDDVLLEGEFGEIKKPL